MKNAENSLEEESNSKNIEKYIRFSLGTEKYAVHLLMVREVIPTPETTSLPNSPAHFIGIMNLRGQIISIYDLRKKLGVKPIAENEEEAVIIVNIEDVSIGFMVDSIDQVLAVPMENVVAVPQTNSQVNTKFIDGVHRGENELTILLNLGKIFDIKEAKNLSSSVESHS